nr:hypothetical protein [Tanacetum cinerariifolium]
ERRIELISDLVRYQDNYVKVHKYQSQQRKPLTKKQQREFYTSVLRNQAGWKAKDFKGMTLEEIKENFNPVWKEDLNQLWALVKESLNIRPASSDKEIELWVELKRLYELDVEDQLWTHTQNMMHALVEWKLYDSCGVHHVTSKDNEIFMLIEKDYPLRKGLPIVMISYKLQGMIVGNKMHKAFPLPVIEFPLPGEVPTASEESSHYSKKRDATAEKIALLLKSSSN